MTLRDYLKKTGTSYAAFARELGVDRSTITRWAKRRGEPGFRAPRVDHLSMILRATHGKVRPIDFLTTQDGTL